MNATLFAELLESVREGGSIHRGEREASRTLFVTAQQPISDDPELAPDAPAPYPFKWTRRIAVLFAGLFLSVLAGGVTPVSIAKSAKSASSACVRIYHEAQEEASTSAKTPQALA